MNNKILYFPYINVPQSAWFCKMLLYWDEVGAIIPYEFIEEPGKLDNFTRELVKENLIKQIIPGAYTWQVPNFKDAFINFLISKDQALLDKRRQAFLQEYKFKIHIEKMEGIARELVNLKLAENIDYRWYFVEGDTAKEFMAYLAATLGKHKELDYAPVTDDINHLSFFKDTSSIESELDNLRIEILDDILPSPNHPIDTFNIKNFKDTYYEELKDFRNNIEKELISLAQIQDPALKLRRIDLFKEESEHQINRIIDAMRNKGISGIGLSKVGSIVSSIPGISGFAGLANAVYNALRRENFSTINPSFLYAAFAKEKISK